MRCRRTRTRRHPGGSSERIFIIDAVPAGGERTDPPRSSSIRSSSFSPETDVHEEGCLSFPGIFVPVKRSLSARINAFDIDGKPFVVEAGELLCPRAAARFDHLENRLLYDHAGAIKRQMIKRKLDRMTDEEAMDILRREGE